MKAIIFDMDGVIIDSETLYFETEIEIGKMYSKEVHTELLKKLMGRNPKEAAEIFLNETKLPITIDEFLNLRDKIMLEKYKNEAQMLPGLHELIQAFYKKLKLAIATGSPEKFLNLVVDKLNIRKYFDVLQSSDNIKNGKPDPEIYLTVIKKLNVKPSECIVLEDSINGALAGKNAGCYTIAIYSEHTKDKNFDFVDYFAQNLFEVKEHISKLIEKN